MEVKKHVENLVKALIALAPSRNYVTQFFMVCPEDFPTLFEAYPEILRDKEVREAFSSLFGVKYADKVEVGFGFGSEIKEFIEKMFNFFEDEEKVKTIKNTTGMYEIPNLRKEWFKLKIDAVTNEPTYGKYAKVLLKKLASEKDRVSFNNLLETTGIEEHEFRRTLDLLEHHFKLITSYRNEEYALDYKLKDNYLDLIISGLQ